MSVYKRGSVYWYEFRFRGRRVRESTGLKNRTAALRAESLRKAELVLGKKGIDRKKCPPFDQFVQEEFLPWSEQQHRNGSTHTRYKVSAKPLLRFFGKIRLDEMSVAGIEKFKVRRLQDCSAAGVNRDLSALRFILNFGVQMGYLERNPFQGVKLLPEGPGMMRIVSPEEEELYLEAAPLILRDVATLILQTGMRPREVFSIQKADVELEERYLFIPKGKTKYARRTIPLSDEALAVLRRRVENAEGDWLFPHRVDENRPMPACRSHDTVVGKLGLDFRLYDLRHTFGSRAAMAGVDLPTLKELMGHSSITLTMRYVHPTPAHKTEAIEKLKNWKKRTPHKNAHRRVRGSCKTLK